MIIHSLTVVYYSLFNAQVYAHVRAANAAEAQKRVEKSLRACQLWTDECAHRVVAVPGDLAAPRLGLEPQWWDTLAKGTLVCALLLLHVVFFPLTL